MVFCLTILCRLVTPRAFWLSFYLFGVRPQFPMLSQTIVCLPLSETSDAVRVAASAVKLTTSIVATTIKYIMTSFVILSPSPPVVK